MRYEGLSTNAHVLSEGDDLTRSQIDALACLENSFVERRGYAAIEEVENVLHAFMCTGLGECVCTQRTEVKA